jgi:hypothetical protein
VSGNVSIATSEVAQLKLIAGTSGNYILFSLSYGDGSVPVNYVMNNAIQVISKGYAFAGLYTISVTALNSTIPLANGSITLNVTGADSCAPPTVGILNPGTALSPVPFNRSSTVSLSGSVSIACSYIYTSTYSWTMKNVATGVVTDMTTNPAFSGYNTGNLVISSNTLGFATYKFTYSVTISYTSNGGGSYTQTATTYVTIVPSGLNVFGFTGGILQQAYGSAQTITVDAGANTLDLDSVINTASLSFVFNCQIVPVGQSGVLFFGNNNPIGMMSSNVWQVQSVFGNCFNCNNYLILFTV